MFLPREVDRLTSGCHQLAVADVGVLRDRFVARGSGTLRDDAALGAIPDDETADWETLVRVVEGDAGMVGSARSQLERTSVLYLSLEHAGEAPGTTISGQPPVVIWVSPPSSYRDVLWFWNYRALRHGRSGQRAWRSLTPTSGRTTTSSKSSAESWPNRRGQNLR